MLAIVPAHQSDQPIDQQLVAAANRGDRAAFEALYERYRDWVVGLAQRFTHDRELALDVLQETFLYLLRQFPGFELTAQLKTFLYPVVRHTALAMARKARRSTKLDSELMAELCANPASRTDLTHLYDAVQALDDGHREVLILRFVDDLSLQEIAVAMQIPLGTVKSRLHHGLNMLRQDARLKRFFID
ncbi:MAG: sigma-70 family RNA polymerase sigma factor [Phycisphaerales bacterium]|nr:sigma-70 family RNA polymerase sigma factor [Phycisphaerales bacterium]